MEVVCVYLGAGVGGWCVCVCVCVCVHVCVLKGMIKRTGGDEVLPSRNYHIRLY